MKPLPLHRHRKLTKLSFREGNNSSAFFSIILGTLIAKTAAPFLSLRLHYYT
jgi:hypothetical protein